MKYEIGCRADGALGHQHVRERLADLVGAVLIRGADSDDAMTQLASRDELDRSLRSPMPDDAWDEHAALDLLNDTADPGHLFELSDGDLIYRKVRCATCGEETGSTGSLAGSTHRWGPTDHRFDPE